MISFGLVRIPVKIYNATREKRLDFDYLRKKDRCRIRYAMVCAGTGEEVPYRDIVRGYQYRKGDYVVLSNEDFRRASVRRSQAIEVVDFIDERDVDLKLLEKPYYLEPDKGSRKLYALFRESLRRSNKVGVVRFVLRTREHMGIVKTEGNAIVLDQMRFAEEILPAEGLDLPADEGLSEHEVGLALKLVDQLSGPFHPEEYKDTYTDELKHLIEEKAHGRVRAAKVEQQVPTHITDLLSKLKESLEYAQKK